MINIEYANNGEIVLPKDDPEGWKLLRNLLVELVKHVPLEPYGDSDLHKAVRAVIHDWNLDQHE